ncbi:ATP synthase F1 subunit epsilon [Candidatus Falkowbacteria bacterium CG11_big_fil_rev_8_21_14_0_20_39_10]|uniref:ATP synthase epsilon chain n=1 Tax=Candidatus Falkowbacteria bacterium CG11_big_fil_rev_8_21_14_0_20_39_10 TaxID=1974570 RepID=A0A2M6K8G9_9BACT|nr:MAG: ATP synthase F1 subunit epsilon [Candidatus Falkowbacteria bacterium CG11_big_fil_rev_8_21_14_0_20_39_10]
MTKQSMSKIIKFEIVTPERVVLKEEIIQVTAPTRMGEITVLPGHIPLISALEPGVIEIVRPDNKREVMSVSGGFIEVLKNKVVILADTAERAEEIDETRAEEARARAKKTIEKIRHLDRASFTGLSAKIAKELARSRAARRWKRIKGE